MSDYQSRKIRKDFVIFREKPATTDEQSIHAMVRDYFSELNSHTPARLHRLLAPGAKINSLFLKKNDLTLDDALAMLVRLPQDGNGPHSVFFDEVWTCVDTPTGSGEAIGLATYFTPTWRIHEKGWFIIRFVRTDTSWLISSVDWNAA